MNPDITNKIQSLHHSAMQTKLLQNPFTDLRATSFASLWWI